jgi:hypothetical protein
LTDRESSVVFNSNILGIGMFREARSGAGGAILVVVGVAIIVVVSGGWIPSSGGVVSVGRNYLGWWRWSGCGRWG